MYCAKAVDTARVKAVNTAVVKAVGTAQTCMMVQRSTPLVINWHGNRNLLECRV